MSASMQPNPRDLLRAAKDGDQEALGRLLELCRKANLSTTDLLLAIGMG